MIDKLRKIWKDSVFSRLIAEIIKWFWIVWIVPMFLAIWAFVKTFIENIDFYSAWSQTIATAKKIANQSINLNISTLVLFIVCYFLLTFFIRKFVFSRKTARIKHYNTDIFWGAIIKWKWEKKDGELKIKYDDFDLICPNSRHNLTFDQDAGHYYLRCNQCGFTSKPYHYEPPSNVVILAPMSDFYFYTALTSMVDAELRHRELK